MPNISELNPEDISLTPPQEVSQSGNINDLDPSDVQSEEEYFSTPEQTTKAALEGVGRGVAGPLAPLIEKKLGVKPEDILAREKAHPVISGLGEAAGLIGTSVLAPEAGIGAIASKAGEAVSGVTEAGAAVSAAEKAAVELGLKGKQAADYVSKTVPLTARVGSSTAKAAAEMAVLQGSDEVSKMILNDPDTSAATAMANVGMAGLLGGATGAFFTGAVSPLWKATIGSKSEEALGELKSFLDQGGKAPLPEKVGQSLTELGIQPDNVMKAALSGDPKAIQLFNELREAQHPEVLANLKALPEEVAKNVSERLGVSLEDLTSVSRHDAGEAYYDAFEKEYNSKYEPIAKELAARDEKAAKIFTSDEARLDQADRMIQSGIERVGTDSPYYKLYDTYAQRLLAKDTIGDVDKLSTEIFNSAKKLGIDPNERSALFHIRDMLKEFQDLEINKVLAKSEKADELIAERAQANAKYRTFAKMSENLMDHLNVAGSFKGAGSLKSKLGEGFTPEALVNKFSPKNNADIVPFLAEHFPDTLAKVQEFEKKRFLSPYVYRDKGELSLDMKGLANKLEKSMKDHPEYTRFALPEDALHKIQAAQTVLDAIPGIKSSGTAGWLSKLTRYTIPTAIGAIGTLAGHGLGASILIGELATRLGKHVPEAIKFNLLKFMGSEKPINAEGFKAGVDFVHNIMKGENAMIKAVGNIFKPGAQVLTTTNPVFVANREKLDKQVDKFQENPNEYMLAKNGNVGHYYPDHQIALAANVTRNLQYLQGLKPQPTQLSPLDKPIPPSKAAIARYNRALDIANNPLVVLDKLKDGTIQASDVQDIKALYPSLYPKLSGYITNTIAAQKANEEPIPYKTKMGLSLFLGQPLDSTMSPQAIISAQPKPKATPQQAPVKNKRGTASLGKSNKNYMTPNQSAESDRSSRE